MTGSSYNNGVSESRSYNSDNTLSSISYSGASIGNLSFSWDDNKNKTAETITGTMSNYGFSIPTSGYDSEDRLVTFNRTSGLHQSWSLSAVGDWNSQTTNGTSQARTHGPTHELTAVAGNSVSTDVKGNMSLIPSAARTGGSSLALAWDFDNRLKSADVGGNGIDVTYQFDALGRRVARTDLSGGGSGTTTVYVQAGQQTIADYTAGANSSSPLYRYVYGSYIDEPVLRYQPTGAQSVYYHRNQQYSVTALTNASGSILERYAYTAYGVPTITNATGTVLVSSAHNNRYTYTGREWDDAIQLYHYRARMYDPALGRFCSKDPKGYVDGPTLYEYVGSRPVLFVDPLGLECLGPFLDLGQNISLREGSWITDTWVNPGIGPTDIRNWAGGMVYTVGIYSDWYFPLHRREGPRSFIRKTVTNSSITVESKIDAWYRPRGFWYPPETVLSANDADTCTIKCVQSVTSQGEACTAVASCPIVVTPDETVVHPLYINTLSAFSAVHLKAYNTGTSTTSVDWFATQGLVVGSRVSITILGGRIEVTPNSEGSKIEFFKYGGASWKCNCG